MDAMEDDVRLGDVVRRAMAAMLLVGAAGCARGAAGDAADDGRLRVVATTGMVADAVARVGGDRVRVQGLMGPGIDPHLYKASAGDVQALASADLVAYNGLHLEAAMGEVLREMNGRIPTVAVAERIPKDSLLAPPEFKGNYDPHVWFDVELWKHAVRSVADALERRDPPGAAVYRANAERYLAELDSLDAWVAAQVAELPEERRILVTAHDAFNYFGRAYGFDVKGLQGISTAAEAGTADVQRLAGLIVERRVPAMFVETSIAPRTIQAVQEAVRARGHAVEIGGSLFSDALGDAATAEGTYVGMVRHNVRTIVDALQEAPAAVAVRTAR
jgi:manganese/zinc/iron transport system substrate-binding protein